MDVYIPFDIDMAASDICVPATLIHTQPNISNKITWPENAMKQNALIVNRRKQMKHSVCIFLSKSLLFQDNNNSLKKDYH